MAKRGDEIAGEALTRAQCGQTLTNYPAIYRGFMERGIPESDIRPRENVFTYHAWRALGRQVRKGEHGVRVLTYVPMAVKELDSAGQERVKELGRKPRCAVVFHVSQTDPIAA